MTIFNDMYKAMKKTKKVQSVVPIFTEWKETGQSIVGRFLMFQQMLGKLNQQPYNQYLFFTDQGLIKFSLGAITDKEVGQFFIPGDMYYIQFEGQEKLDEGRRVNKWKIEHVLLSIDELKELPGPKPLQALPEPEKTEPIITGESEDIPF